MAGHGDQCGLGNEVPMRFSTAVFPKTLAWIGSPVSDDGLSEPQAIAFHKHLDLRGGVRGGGKEAMAVLFDVEQRLSAEQAKYQHADGKHYAAYLQRDHAGEQAPADAGAGTCELLHVAAWALAKFVPSIDYVRSVLPVQGQVHLKGAHMVELALPSHDDGDGVMFSQMGDLRTLSGAVDVNCPAGVDDGPGWQALLKKLSTAITHDTMLNLAAKRGDKAAWLAMVGRIKVDGSLRALSVASMSTKGFVVFKMLNFMLESACGLKDAK